MARVLITGGSGFVGTAALRALLGAGHDVICIGRSQPAVGEVEFHPFDMLTGDPAPLLRSIAASHLLHLAWHGERSSLMHGAENIAWTAATLRLASAFRDAGGTRAVFAGSCAEYDWTQPLLDDRDPVLRPATLYGQAKHAACSLLAYGALKPVSVAWARIFFPFGPDDKPDRLLSTVIDGLAAGRAVDCSSGHQVRPFIHVDDVAEALTCLLDAPFEGPVNVALDQVCAVREIALMAARLVGDPALVRFGSHQDRPTEPLNMRAAVRRLSDETGFRPHYDIERGVAATVAARLADIARRNGDYHA